MAITRAQQAKQMLQNGGMLVQPGFGGARQGYRGDDAYGGGGDKGGNQDGNGGREDRIGNQYSSPEGKAVDRGSNRENVERVNKMLTGLRQTISPSTQPGNRALRTILNITTPGLGEVFANTIDKQQPDIFGTSTDDDDDINRGDGGLFAPIVSRAPMTSAPVTSAPTVDTGANLNRIAYRLMADGGAVMDDEPRQAYGLGSIVKKATRAVKKVAKSPIGKAALLYAGTAGLGALGAGAQGTGFGFSMFAPSAVASNLSLTAGRIGASSLFNNRVNLNDYDPARNIFQRGLDAVRTTGTGKAMAGIAALSALPLLGVGVEEDEEENEGLSPYLGEGLDIADIRSRPRFYQGQAYRLMAEGGDTEDAKEPVAKKVMPLLDMDGMEKDY